MANILFSIQNYIGYLDIAIIALAIVGVALGFIVGFGRIFIKIASWLGGLIFSLIFCSGFSKLLNKLFGTGVYNHFYNKIAKSDTIANLSSEATAKEGLEQALKEMGIPKFLRGMLSNNLSSDSIKDVADNICNAFATSITKIIFIVISFFVLWFGIAIILFLVKLHVEDLREYKWFRIIDGIFGIAVACTFVFVFLEIAGFILTLADSSNSIMNFLTKDMRLEKESGVPIARWFYKNNWIKAFFNLFF